MLQKETDSIGNQDSTTWKQLASTVLCEMSYSANRDLFEVLEAQGNQRRPYTVRNKYTMAGILVSRSPS